MERISIFYFIPVLGWVIPHITVHLGLTTAFQGLGQTPLQTENKSSFKEQVPEYPAKIRAQIRLVVCVLSLQHEDSFKAEILAFLAPGTRAPMRI